MSAETIKPDFSHRLNPMYRPGEDPDYYQNMTTEIIIEAVVRQ